MSHINEIIIRLATLNTLSPLPTLQISIMPLAIKDWIAINALLVHLLQRRATNLITTSHCSHNIASIPQAADTTTKINLKHLITNSGEVQLVRMVAPDRITTNTSSLPTTTPVDTCTIISTLQSRNNNSNPVSLILNTMIDTCTITSPLRSRNNNSNPASLILSTMIEKTLMTINIRPTSLLNAMEVITELIMTRLSNQIYLYQRRNLFNRFLSINIIQTL